MAVTSVLEIPVDIWRIGGIDHCAYSQKYDDDQQGAAGILEPFFLPESGQKLLPGQAQ